MPVIKETALIGKRVILEDASDVGTLIDIYVDTLDWRMTRLDIRIEKRYAERLGKEKGLLKRPVISAPIHLLNTVGDVVHLKGDLDDLAKTQKAILPPAEARREAEREAAAASARASKEQAPPKKPGPASPPAKDTSKAEKGEKKEKKEKPRSL
jgi:sporulation protein YlmC with PRC-barrel domain